MFNENVQAKLNHSGICLVIETKIERKTKNTAKLFEVAENELIARFSLTHSSVRKHARTHVFFSTSLSRNNKLNARVNNKWCTLTGSDFFHRHCVRACIWVYVRAN